MKIIKLSSRNIKNLKAVEITPDGNLVTLTGKNGAGKSAVLDSIFSTLTGKRLKDPVRHGEERADVVVEIGEYTVKKRWTSKGEMVEVSTRDEDDKKQVKTSPQMFLNKIIGDLSFDPLAFQNMDSGDQVELLKKVVGLDFTDLDKDSEGVYNDRTVLNSRVKESIAHLKNTEAPDPQTPDEEIKFKDALERLNTLRKKQEVYQNVVRIRTDHSENIVAARQEIGSIDEEYKRLVKRKNDLDVAIRGFEHAIEKTPLPAIISQDDTKDAEIELEQIEHKNADIRAAKRYREAIRQADKLKKASDELTEKLRRIDQDKQTRVAAAKMPIVGLGIDNEIVIYDKIPFDRLSTGQQIRVSTAISMALNPKLKVIFIREGSLLDSDGLKEIAAMAKDQDYQVWIEKCDETGQVGLYIEAGEIKAIDGKETKKEGGDVNGNEPGNREDKVS